MAAVAALGCIVCGNHATVHHIRKGCGMGQRASHYDTIPLCPTHHQNGGFGVAIHAGQREFENNFGSEEKLLEETRGRLENSCY
jgi:hypothetical protein